MELELTQKQNLAYWTAEENIITLFGGAIRGGKSFWLLICFITYCLEYPGSRWAIVRRDLPTLKRNTLTTFGLLLDSGVSQYIDAVNHTELTYKFTNGSELLFMAESYDSDKDLNRFKGLEVNGFGLDEGNELREETFNKCIERAGTWQKVKIKPKILITCNPAYNWIKTRIYDRFINNTLPPGWSYIPSFITDNPHISEEYKESLKLLPEFEYEVFVRGNWEIKLKTGGEFYKRFDINRHIGDVEYNPKLPLHISFDDNVNPYLPVGIFQIDGRRVYGIAEITGKSPDNTVEAVCREFIRLFPGHTAGLFVYGDATADKDDTKLAKGFRFYRLITDALAKYKPTRRVPASNPSVVMRGNFINTVFEKNFNGLSVLIDRKCKTMIEDFTNLKEAADGTKLKKLETDPETKISYQKYGHFTDLFDYMFIAAFMDDYIEYQRGGVAPGVTLGENRRKNSY